MLRARNSTFHAQREHVLFFGPPGTSNKHVVNAIGRAAICRLRRRVSRRTSVEELAKASSAGTRKDYVAELTTVSLSMIDDIASVSGAARGEIPEPWSARRNADSYCDCGAAKRCTRSRVTARCRRTNLEEWRRVFHDCTQGLKNRVEPEERELNRV